MLSEYKKQFIHQYTINIVGICIPKFWKLICSDADQAMSAISNNDIFYYKKSISIFYIESFF